MRGSPMLGSIFERFIEHSPVSVMVRGLMERIFAAEKLMLCLRQLLKCNTPENCCFQTWWT